MICPDIQSSLFTSIKSLKNLYPYGFRIVEFSNGSSYDFLKDALSDKCVPRAEFLSRFEGRCSGVGCTPCPSCIATE
jgi:hypothetical protein